MNNVERKNINRRHEAANVRHNRVIVGYIELKHPETYKEAEEFYEQLNAKYPNKKDLRRTNEYEWLKSDFPEFKQRKYYLRKKKDSSEQAKIVDNMELVIPLMSSSEKPKEAVDMSGDTQIEITIEQPPYSPTDTQQVEVTTELFPTISDETIEDMISELREDPDLDLIFNDFDIDFGDYDEETPLERELLNW